jgi:hypothetical protein
MVVLHKTVTCSKKNSSTTTCYSLSLPKNFLPIFFTTFFGTFCYRSGLKRGVFVALECRPKNDAAICDDFHLIVTTKCESGQPWFIKCYFPTDLDYQNCQLLHSQHNTVVSYWQNHFIL